MAVCSLLFHILILFFAYQQSGKVRVLGDNLVPADTRSEQVPTCQGTPPKGINGREYGVPLIPSPGPCSPYHQGRSRGHSSSVTVDQEEDFTVPISSETNYQYLVQVGIGTPSRTLTLIMDTGSDLLWTQCVPCRQRRCKFYKQHDPFFQTDKSSTLHKMSCPSNPGDCTYKIPYLDKSSSAGYKARDTLSIGSSYHAPNLTFGCSQWASSKDNTFGKAAGVLGLNNRNGGFLSQTRSTLNGTFCFCIPPRDTYRGYLAFGDEARAQCQVQASTPLVDETDYIVNLYGITIGNERINMPNNGSTRALIDSGTTISKLPPELYQPLKTKFREYMSRYTSELPRDESEMDTCYYDLNHNIQSAPRPEIVLHFDQANVTLDPAGVARLFTDHPKALCLPFAESKVQTIIGSTQLKGLDVLFDVNARKVGFGRGRCGGN